MASSEIPVSRRIQRLSASLAASLAASLSATLAMGGTIDAGGADPISAEVFGCIRDMTPVRGFYVANLDGDLETTLAVANSPTGGVYPPGSVVQLVPTEVMVKRTPGFNAATRDWEFFELDVSPGGSTIRARGFADVVNRFGGNCFGCHVRARPEWDMICEQDHGCEPIPLTPVMTRALQKTDPRCPEVELSVEETEALAALRAAMTAPAD